MPDLNYGLTQSADDAREASGTVNIDSVSMSLSGAAHYVGVSFATAGNPIAQATTITLAELTYNFISSGEPYMTWKGHKVTNSAAFSTTASDVSSRYTAGTTAYTTDDATGLSVPGTRTIDVTAVVQELVNQAGWTNGRLTFVAQPISGVVNIVLRSWDYSDHSAGATLHVVTAAGGVTRQAMYYARRRNG